MQLRIYFIKIVYLEPNLKLFAPVQRGDNMEKNLMCFDVCDLEFTGIPSGFFNHQEFRITIIGQVIYTVFIMGQELIRLTERHQYI